MTRTLRSSLLLAPFAWALLTSGCSSSDSNSTTDEGGSAGSNAGSDTGGNGGDSNLGGDGGSAPLGGSSNAGAAGETGGNGETGGAGGDTGGTGVGGTGGETGGAANQGVQGDPGTTGEGQSAQPEPYNEPDEVTMHLNGAPTGTVLGPELYTSKGLYPDPDQNGNFYKFQYFIYVPAQYEPGKPAALMVFQDDLHYLGMTDAHFNTPTVFDNLIHSGDMPVTIGLFINTGTPDGTFNFDAQRLIREMEYSTYSDTYARFLLEEIIPDVITSHYDIVSDPDGWAIGGQSSGGLCSLNVGMFRSNNFHKILTANGAFDNAGTAYPGAIENSPVLPLRVYLLSGPNDIPITYSFNQQVVAALDQKGYHYRYLEGTGFHFPPLQAVADYPNALRWLWSKYTLPWYP